MKLKAKQLLLVFVGVLFLSCSNSQQNNTAIKVVSPQEFKQLSNQKTIIDIRTPGEFAQGHIEGAVNINYFDKNFINKIAEFNKNEPLFVYCRSGNRTSSASRKIANMGFTQIYDLEGGMINWVRNKNQLVK